MEISKIVLLAGLLLIFVQCDSPHYYEDQVSVKNSWNYKAPVNFKFEVNDSVGKYDFYLLSRNNNEYPYSNLYLFTKLTNPHGETFSDTLQYFLAFKDGEWVGTGRNLKELYLLYRENVPLQDTGTYMLTVWQGMRDENLVGIEDISLIVDKTD